MSDAVELLSALIRNQCVNDATVGSGGELRSVETLAAYLPTTGHDQVVVEPEPGRGSMVCRIEGSDPTAPGLTLMGHLDVVPVADPSRWQHDPFGGELIDDVVWGRGAVDMLDVTTAMAAAFKRLVDRGVRPRGTLTFLAVADEEALGTYGAQYLTEREPDLVATDVVLTELGGMRYPHGTADAPIMPVMVGEKGTYWCTLRVRGTPGHASMPLRTDNALVTAAEVVRRLHAYAPQPVMHETWRAFVTASGLPDEMVATLLDAGRLEAFLAEAPLGEARMFHACTHTTFAPTILKAGVKTNMIPDSAELQVDVRTLPGHGATEVRAMLAEALGDLWDRVDVVADAESLASTSRPDGRVIDAIGRVTANIVPGARTVPSMLVAATDARHFRRVGAQCYGVGLKSDRIPYERFVTMFHGDNECVDVETVHMQIDYFEQLAEALVC